MNAAPPPLRLVGLVERGEQPVLVSAARQYAAAVGAAIGGEWSLRLSFAEDDRADVAGAAIVRSLRTDLLSAEPIDAVTARWESWAARCVRSGVTIVVPTLYRHVADPAAAVALVERIRRLNALAIALSCAHGIGVADIDRGFAAIGAQVLGSDYRCTGDRAALVAGHIVADALLAMAPGLPPAVSVSARAAHGTLAALMERHGRRAA